MSKHKGKGFSIIFIPTRGHSKTFHIPSYMIYMLSLFMVIAFVFAYQFFQQFNQLRREYIVMNSFSMEAKQRILSEELFAVQQVMEEVYPVIEANKEKMMFIGQKDQEVRKHLNLKENDLSIDKFTLQPAKNRKNLAFFDNFQLNLMNAMNLQEKAETLARKLDERTENLLTAEESSSVYLTRLDQTPNIWPVPGVISPGYGWRIHPIFRVRDFHTGVDITAARGYPIQAAADGLVTDTGRFGGYGIHVQIYHRDGISTLYAHCDEVLVKVGDYVKKGSIIARAGETGTATHPHLHYEVRMYGEPVNPEAFYLEGRISR